MCRSFDKDKSWRSDNCVSGHGAALIRVQLADVNGSGCGSGVPGVLVMCSCSVPQTVWSSLQLCFLVFSQVFWCCTSSPQSSRHSEPCEAVFQSVGSYLLSGSACSSLSQCVVRCASWQVLSSLISTGLFFVGGEAGVWLGGVGAFLFLTAAFSRR